MYLEPFIFIVYSLVKNAVCVSLICPKQVFPPRQLLSPLTADDKISKLSNPCLLFLLLNDIVGVLFQLQLGQSGEKCPLHSFKIKKRKKKGLQGTVLLVIPEHNKKQTVKNSYGIHVLSV